MGLQKFHIPGYKNFRYMKLINTLKLVTTLKLIIIGGLILVCLKYNNHGTIVCAPTQQQSSSLNFLTIVTFQTQY